MSGWKCIVLGARRLFTNALAKRSLPDIESIHSPSPNDVESPGLAMWRGGDVRSQTRPDRAWPSEQRAPQRSARREAPTKKITISKT